MNAGHYNLPPSGSLAFLSVISLPVFAVLPSCIVHHRPRPVRFAFKREERGGYFNQYVSAEHFSYHSNMNKRRTG